MHNHEGGRLEPVPEPPLPPVPRPPNPSADTGIIVRNEDHTPDAAASPDTEILNVFGLKPVAALKILCGLIETLVQITGDVPPTPPVTQPPISHLGSISLAKENVVLCSGPEDGQRVPPSAEDDDGVPPKAKTPIGSPEAHPTEPLHVVGVNMAPSELQHGTIARKFYSKKPPPISLEEYLLRLHRFCPMSTAVYLATSLYIHRLSVVENTLPVTPRNAHRLVLAGLRVAMKALEDQSYPHRRFAKVGGVSEPELRRLEISFCFLTDFELKVNEDMLFEHTKAVRGLTMLYQVPVGYQPKLPSPKDKRSASFGQHQPPGTVTKDAPASA